MCASRLLVHNRLGAWERPKFREIQGIVLGGLLHGCNVIVQRAYAVQKCYPEEVMALVSSNGTGERKLLYTVNEVAVLLSIGRTKVRELVDSGQILSVRIGRAVRVPTQCLDDYIDRLAARNQFAGLEIVGRDGRRSLAAGQTAFAGKRKARIQTAYPALCCSHCGTGVAEVAVRETDSTLEWYCRVCFFFLEADAST